MSPSATMNGTSATNGTASEEFQNDLDLSVVGLGVAYPEFAMGPEAIQTLAGRHYPDSLAFVGDSVRSFSQPPLFVF